MSLPTPDLKLNDRYGSSVAITPTSYVIVVGADRASLSVDGESIDSGAVFSFSAQLTKNGINWNEERIDDPSPQHEARFGNHVAISDDGLTLAVGAWKKSITSSNSSEGEVTIFQRRDRLSPFSLNQAIALPVYYTDSGVDSLSLSASGDLVVFSSSDVENNRRGFCWVSSFTATSKSWSEAFELLPPVDELPSGADYGKSVATCHDSSAGMTTIAIGAPGSAKIFLFQKADSKSLGWFQLEPVTHPTLFSSAIGVSVALAGDQCHVLATGNHFYSANGLSRTGVVSLFERSPPSGNSWTLQFATTAGDRAQSTGYFGLDIALSRDASVLLVSARLHDVDGKANRGEAFAFYRSPSWSASNRQLIEAPGTSLITFFSFAVALSENGRKSLFSSLNDQQTFAGNGNVYLLCTFNTSCSLNECPSLPNLACGEEPADSSIASSSSPSSNSIKPISSFPSITSPSSPLSSSSSISFISSSSSSSSSSIDSINESNLLPLPILISIISSFLLFCSCIVFIFLYIRRKRKREEKKRKNVQLKSVKNSSIRRSRSSSSRNVRRKSIDLSSNSNSKLSNQSSNYSSVMLARPGRTEYDSPAVNQKNQNQIDVYDDYSTPLNRKNQNLYEQVNSPLT